MEICIARTVSRIHRCKCVFVCFEHFNTCLECVLVDSWQSHVSLARSSKSSHYRLTASECISRFGIGFQPCAPATNHTHKTSHQLMHYYLPTFEWTKNTSTQRSSVVILQIAFTHLHIQFKFVVFILDEIGRMSC